jgi:hypothetical protein
MSDSGKVTGHSQGHQHSYDNLTPQKYTSELWTLSRKQSRNFPRKTLQATQVRKVHSRRKSDNSLDSDAKPVPGRVP